MPIYCYTTDDGCKIERQFRMGKAPKTVTTGDGLTAIRDFQAEWGRKKGANATGWPIWVDSMGVAPEQIPEAQAEMKKHGVTAEFCPDTGRLKVNDRSHMGKCLRACGMKDNDAGYGDYAGGDPIE